MSLDSIHYYTFVILYHIYSQKLFEFKRSEGQCSTLGIVDNHLTDSAIESIEQGLHKKNFENNVEVGILSVSQCLDAKDGNDNRNECCNATTSRKDSQHQNDNIGTDNDISEFASTCLDMGFKDNVATKGIHKWIIYSTEL